MEVLTVDEASGFTQIRTSLGTEGWVRSQYLTRQPIAKVRLAAAQREITSLKQQLASQLEQANTLTSTSRSQRSSLEQSTQRIQELETELAELKAISENAVNTYESNMALTETNLRLKDELDDIAEERMRLEDNNENQAFMIGAGLILLGLLLGILIKARPHRSAWN